MPDNPFILWAAAIVTIGIPLFSFLWGWMQRIHKGETAQQKVAELEKTVEEHKTKIATLAIDKEQIEKNAQKIVVLEATNADIVSRFSAHKLHVAETYVSNHTLNEFEKRVTSAIDRLGDRLDRWFEASRAD